jgi:SAM-dependent methyltransferase
VCGDDELRPGAVVSSPSALDMGFDELRPYWHGFFKEHVFFPYGRCRTCGQLYNPVYFSPAQLERLYGDMPDNTAGVDQESLRRTQERYAAVLRRHTPATGDYLELGPDIGLFTAPAVADNDEALLYLFEPNRAVWPVLAERFGAGRCRLSGEMEDYSEVPDASIGSAAMVHVLDHLLDPVGLLRSIAVKLAPGGVLAIVTHDESSLMARVLGPRWLPYCLQHPEVYRPSTLREVVGAAGLEVVAQERTSNEFPLTYLVKHGLAAAGLPHDRVPSASRPTVALKLGNVITVARRAGEPSPRRK